MGEGSAPTTDGSADALSTLNLYIESQNLRRLLAVVARQNAFSTVVGTSVYTVGSGISPVALTSYTPRFEAATISVSGYDRALEIVAVERFATFPRRTQSGQPELLFYQPTGGQTGFVYLAPIPNAIYSVTPWVWSGVGSTPIEGPAFGTLTSSRILGPGVGRLLTLGLAKEIAETYGTDWTEGLETRYQDARSALMDLTGVDLTMEPSELPFGQQGSGYDIRGDRTW